MPEHSWLNCICSTQDLKLNYYDLMIQFALHGKEYLDAAQYYHNVWETPTVKKDVAGKGKEV